jgi:hypothetical protein
VCCLNLTVGGWGSKHKRISFLLSPLPPVGRGSLSAWLWVIWHRQCIGSSRKGCVAWQSGWKPVLTPNGMGKWGFLFPELSLSHHRFFSAVTTLPPPTRGDRSWLCCSPEAFSVRSAACTYPRTNTGLWWKAWLGKMSSQISLFGSQTSVSGGSTSLKFHNIISQWPGEKGLVHQSYRGTG